jgi:hypothetical protein
MTEQSGARQLVKYAVAAGVKEYVDAGFADVAVVHVGDEGQGRFLAAAAGPLLHKLGDL